MLVKTCVPVDLWQYMCDTYHIAGMFGGDWLAKKSLANAYSSVVWLIIIIKYGST